jgi:CRP-like cAMP-binding protein
VYFPESGLVSLNNISRSGDSVEVGIIGADGVVGGTALLDDLRSTSQATVQIPGKALKMPTRTFLESCNSTPMLRRLVARHQHLMLFEAQQTAACHALHSAEGRFCRWLLQARDLVRLSAIELTQESLSALLGVQRTSVSVIAHTLQNAGLIRYRRGRIEVIDELGLEEAACDCYNLIKQEIGRQLLSPHDRLQYDEASASNGRPPHSAMDFGDQDLGR